MQWRAGTLVSVNGSGWALTGAIGALGAFYRASPRLTLGLLVLATGNGLLGVAFMLATGALVAAFQDGRGYIMPVSAVAAIFTVQRVLDPVRGYLEQILWPRVDESLDDRIMAAVSAPVGLRELEDPHVLDRIEHARGAMTGFTPGRAAEEFAALWSLWPCAFSRLPRWRLCCAGTGGPACCSFSSTSSRST